MHGLSLLGLCGSQETPCGEHDGFMFPGSLARVVCRLKDLSSTLLANL